MPAQIIIQLITVLGPSAIGLIDSLIQKWQSNADVTPAEWATLVADLKTTAQDHMRAQLQAAGIPLDDPHAVALLNLSK